MDEAIRFFINYSAGWIEMWGVHGVPVWVELWVLGTALLMAAMKAPV